MKIGIDGRLWNESGVGRYIRNLVNGIDEKKLDNDFVIFLTNQTFNKIDFKNPNIKKTVSNSRWHTISEQWKFKEEIERQNVDLMHFTYFSYPIFYRRPFVITIHDLIIDHFPTGVASSLPLPLYKLKHFGYKRIIKSSVRNASKIIVPSKATEDELLNHYPSSKDKTEVVYEGFDPSIKGNNTTRLVSKNYILYVGNAYPHKNLSALIKSFRTIRKKAGVDLVCIGREDFFYKKINKNNDGIYFLHNIDDSSLFDYYTNARLFVMPSLMEGFGLPILEAMSLSCPVVSSNTPALKEIAGNACTFFDPEKIDDMSNAVTKVLGDSRLCEDLILKGRIQAKKFTWQECIDKTLKVYESSNSLRPS